MFRKIITGSLLALSTGCAVTPPSSLGQFVPQARAAGGQDVRLRVRADGGGLLGGTLADNQFAIAIPPHWNRQALLFAHGYTMPGTPTTVSKDPIAKDESLGLMAKVYAQGFAVGQSAYSKSGVAVENGAWSTLRLKRLMNALGAERVYVSGASMGGNIVMSLIEKHPTEFAGALSVCGAVDSFNDVTGEAITMRAVYNYYTAGSKYAVPGMKNIGQSAVSTKPPWRGSWAGGLYRLYLLKREAGPGIALFKDAAKNPNGKAASIVARIASVTGVSPEPGSILYPLLTAALGMDDIRASSGGNPFSNRTTRYHGAILSDAENKELNRDIQRIDSDPSAVAYADSWYTSTGRFSAPLLAMHNRIDSLVPESQLKKLQQKAIIAGNASHLVTIIVPPQEIAIPLSGGLRGYAHCGFSPTQLAASWETLRLWVESGHRPLATDVRDVGRGPV